MAMTNQPPKILQNNRSVWASNTLNRQIFSESEISQGIAYKGPVVSNQLNGALYDVYSLVNTLLGFGFYNANRDYNYNDIVLYIKQNQQTGQTGLEFARCINESEPNESGIKDKTTKNQLPYQGCEIEYGDPSKGSGGCIIKTQGEGVVNSDYWEVLKLYNHMGYKVLTKDEYDGLPSSLKSQDVLYFVGG